MSLDNINSGTDGRRLVTTAGTPVQLVTTPTPCAGVFVNAESDNTGVIAVGFSNAVRASLTNQNSGWVLGARERVFIPVSDASLLWLDTSANGDGIGYSIVQRV